MFSKLDDFDELSVRIREMQELPLEARLAEHGQFLCLGKDAVWLAVV